jgi:hypothetical protein
MAKNENKTRPTELDVGAYLASVEPDRRREDAQAVCELMARVTGEPPVLWGDGIVGFGRYHYRTDAGREGDWMLTGFAPRKSALSLYIMPGYGAFDDVLARLGKHKHGKACLYINRLADIDLTVLEELVGKSVKLMRERHPPDGA